MNCPHCQKELVPGTAFCSNCGRQVAPQAAPVYPDPYTQQYQQYQQQRGEVRRRELNELGRLHQYFSRKQGVYDAYDQTCGGILHYARGTSNALLIWGCILFSLFMIVYIGFLTGEFDSDLDTLGIVLGIPGFLMLAGGIIMKVVNRSKYNKCREMYELYSVELYQYYLGCPNCPIGPEYTNPQILAKLMNIINSGRCDTISDSINCMIADSNYATITKYCQDILENTAQINANTRVATIFAPTRLFR